MQMDILKSACTSLMRQKRKMIITVTGIVIGVASVMIISGISHIGKNTITAELANLGVSGISITPSDQASQLQLDEKYLQKIKQMDMVKSAVPVLAKYIDVGVKNESTQCFLWGIDTGEKQAFNLTLLHGRLLSGEDIRAGRNICVVDEVFAQKTYKRSNIVGKKIQMSLNGVPKDYEIVGVASSGGMLTQGILSNFTPYFIYMPYSTMQRESGLQGFTQIAVKLKDESLQNGTAGMAQLLAQLERETGQPGAFTAQNMAEKGTGIEQVLDIVSLVLTMIAGISLLVSGLTIMIVMYSGISERTREIGIKKAIGAKQRHIAAEFLTEAVLLSVIGAVIGIAGGIGIVLIGCAVFGIPFSIDYGVTLACFLFSVIIGSVFGLFPALKAAKLNPVEAFVV